MPCLPYKFCTEGPYTEPFVHHLNRVENHNYVLEEFLDDNKVKAAQPTPEPEAIYSDNKVGKLTIERKLLIWPEDSVKRHKFWHKFFDALLPMLNETVKGAALKLLVPHEIDISPRDIEKGREHINCLIRENLSTLLAGGQVVGDFPFPFRARLQHESERFSSQPKSGVLVSSSRRDWPANFAQIEADLFPKIIEYLEQCQRKFEGWSQTRRILLLEVREDAKWLSLEEINWKKIINDCPDEVWSAFHFYDPNDRDDPFAGSWFDSWEFERVF